MQSRINPYWRFRNWRGLTANRRLIGFLRNLRGLRRRSLGGGGVDVDDGALMFEPNLFEVEPAWGRLAAYSYTGIMLEDITSGFKSFIARLSFDKEVIFCK